MITTATFGLKKVQTGDNANLYTFINDNMDILDAHGHTANTWSEVTGKPSTFPPSSHSHSYNPTTGTNTDVNTHGATIIDNIYMTNGVITSHGTRNLTYGDVGAASANHGHSTTRVQDVRGLEDGDIYFELPPSGTPDHAISSYFGYVSGVAGAWKGILNLKGWSGNYANWQLIGPATSSADQRLYFRGGAGASWNSVCEVWHSGRQGSGSGLDADKVDGYNIQKNGSGGSGVINFIT